MKALHASVPAYAKMKAKRCFSDAPRYQNPFNTRVWRKSIGSRRMRVTHSQDDLQGAVGHLHILVLQHAARNADVAVVLWGPGWRRGHGGHPAARAVFHPPGAMHGDVEGHDQVCVLKVREQSMRNTSQTVQHNQEEHWEHTQPHCHTSHTALYIMFGFLVFDVIEPCVYLSDFPVIHSL